MLSIVFILPAYVATSFLASALLVRLAPKLYTSVKIRRHLILFLVLPALLLIDVVQLSAVFAKQLSSAARSGFEILTGRKLLTRHHAYYGYAQRRPRRTAGRNRSAKVSMTASNHAKRNSRRWFGCCAPGAPFANFISNSRYELRRGPGALILVGWP